MMNIIFISSHQNLACSAFCMNYCINEAWHEGDQPMAKTTAFRLFSLLCLVSLIFLSTILCASSKAGVTNLLRLRATQVSEGRATTTDL